MISVIVPVYNAEDSVARCVESILNQSFSDFELLLVDDGSADGSGEICDSLAVKDTRIRVFHQTNQGVSAARNTGLDNARGEYVTFADADDYVEPTWLSDFAGVAGKADIIFQNAVWHYPDEKLFLRSVDVDTTLSYKEQLASLYPRNFLGYVWSAIYKTNIVREGGVRFNTTFSYKEDLDFSLNYCKYAMSLMVLPCRNYHYMFPKDRDYNKPGLSRLLLEIAIKDNMYAILGDSKLREVVTDAGIKNELVRIYGLKGADGIKREALSKVYRRIPLDNKGGGKISHFGIHYQSFSTEHGSQAFAAVV